MPAIGMCPTLKEVLCPTDSVLIVMNGTTKEQAPIGTEGWSLWAQGFMKDWLDECGVTPSCWVDLHATTVREEPKGWDAAYPSWLKRSAVPVLLRRKHRAYPASVSYPWVALRAQFQDFAFPLAGTLDHLILLAGIFGVSRVGLYGCDYDSAQERLTQTFGAAFAIGWVMGRGVKVVIPKSSPLLWNVCAGQYGEHFPPWPYGLDPRQAEIFENQDMNRITAFCKRPSRLTYA